MFYSIDDKIVEVGGKFPERKVNSLTFQVAGTFFPFPNTNNGADHFAFKSSKPNNCTINWGDGVVESFVFSPVSNYYYLQFNPYGDTGGGKNPRHTFTDGFTGIRNITFEFQDIQSITEIDDLYIDLRGLFPVSVNAVTDLERIRIYNSFNLEEFPLTISKNKNLKILDFRKISSIKLQTIPDAFFDLPLQNFTADNVFNLSDTKSSNFFKINQLKDTITKIDFTRCDIKELPNSIIELQNLVELRLFINDFDRFPSQLNSLLNLEILYLGNKGTTYNIDSSWADIGNLHKLRIFLYTNSDVNVSNISFHFRGLFSLDTIFMGNNFFVDTNLKFDTFIDEFYTLVSTEAYLNTSSAPAGEQYPNKFRNVSWGASTLTQTGAIQAPAVDGDPQNQGEKIHELVNKYGHNVTTSENFN